MSRRWSRRCRGGDLHHLDLLQPGQRRAARGDGRADVTKSVRHRRDPRDRGGPAQPLLIARDLRKHFRGQERLARRQESVVQAVDGVSFTVPRARRSASSANPAAASRPSRGLLMHLIVPDAGELVFDGDTVGAPSGIAVESLRRQVQMVFQDSYSSLNPRLTVGARRSRSARSCRQRQPRRVARARDLLDQVGLEPSTVRRPLSARAVGRAEAARQHRPRARHRAAHGDPGRGGLGARQIGRGAGAQPAASS